ncbi:flagellar filament capping protein FliD [Paenibacillus sp. N4]|uniref:flagellar filament capping protein FliD n=1 Tax=Paenibacillus vietnamensis TaxID=2590547 RepID=UPI001CD17717|nr:flagellar filament capping protein FliD [Paenibacillus vietnamensis]MCA0757559.1 flagellar filament capping protein FliD [Paenibacillus vietnamensis]
MRIGGLASGMDTDALVKQMMDAQRIPLDKLAQKKQLLEWKRDDYRTLNNKILEFRNAAFDMKLQSGYLTKKVSSSQESIVSVTSSASASEGQYTIQIDKLAKSASLTSGDLRGAAGGSKTVGYLGLDSDTQLQITGDKGAKTIDIKTTDTIDQLVSAINQQTASTGVKATYDSTMDRLFFTSSKTGESSIIELELTNGQNMNDILAPEVNQGTLGTNGALSKNSLVNGSLVGTAQFTVTYDGAAYNFDVTNTTTVQELVDQINDELSDDGLDVSLNSSGKLSFYNRDSKALAFSDDQPDSSVVEALGIDTGLTPLSNSTTSVAGTNAKVFFNGIEAEYESNTFTIVGMTFTAKQEGGSTVDIGVTQDTDKIVETIKTFVEKYNSLIDEVNKELSEKRYRDFQPLTDAQREEMDEDEIKKWEERARSGMLTNDNLLSNGLNSLRRALSDSVNGLPAGQLKSLAEIGISNSNISGGGITGSYSDRGKLYIDETKLKKALTDNPEEVMALFTTDGASDSNDGIATRLYDKASALFKQITDKAGTTTSVDTQFLMGKENKQITEQMSRLEARLLDLENRYYKQFTAMEKYISQMNSQSDWLYQQFSS